MLNIATVIGLIKSFVPQIDPADIETAVSDWLTAHPEATTTVQDGSITEAKLASDVLLTLSTLESDVSDVKSGIQGMTTATASDVGKALSPKTVADGEVTEWKFVSVGGGGGGTSDYTDLDNKPQINGVTLAGNKTPSDLGLASDVDVNGFLYSVSNGGTGTKTFDVSLKQGKKYVYTNLSSAGQNLSVIYTDDTQKSISGNIASGASVAIEPEKDVKAVTGWYNASATFTIAMAGLIADVAAIKSDLSQLETDVETIDTRVETVEDSVRTLLNVTPVYSEIGYLQTNGTIYGVSSARHTVFVSVDGYSKIRAEAYVPNGVFAVAFFTEDKLSALMPNGSVEGDNKVNTIYEVTIPSGAKFAMMSHLTTGAFIGDPKATIYSTKSFENNVIKNTFDIAMGKSAFMAYHKFGVIGDSLSVGYTGNPITGQDSNRNIAYSWPQFLARMCGNIALNFGYSGLTSKTWLSSAYGYTRLIDSDNLCQGYILALGVNDTANLTLGTVSDIGTDADTFYRYYSDIITLVNNTAPNAQIFLLTMPYPITEASNNFNNAIRTISEQSQFDNVYLVDLAANYNDYFKDDRINGEKSAGHFSCIGYANIAGVIGRALSDVMNQNPDEFISIPFLQYGSNDILD